MLHLNDVYGILSGREFSIPVLEVTVYVIIISFCLLFGRYKLGLLTSYCFVFYWGFYSNLTNFVSILGDYTWGMPLYIFSGFLMFIVAIIGFLVRSNE